MIVVTGASGFLGSAIVNECRRRGFDVRPVALRGLSPLELRPAFEGAGTIIHAAGLAHGGGKFTPPEYRAVNVDLTRTVAEGAGVAGVPRLVLVSSVAVYGGGNESSVDEDIEPRPGTPYAWSKLEGERAASAASQQNGTALFILRPATIIGEGDPGNVLRLIDAIARHRFIWLGTGVNRKSLIHRDDVANACVIAATAEEMTPGVYNIAAESPKMRDVVALITRRLDRSPLRIPIPDAVLRRLSPVETLRKWASNDVYDGTRFMCRTGFAPAISWEQALDREIDWYLSERAVQH